MPNVSGMIDEYKFRKTEPTATLADHPTNLCFYADWDGLPGDCIVLVSLGCVRGL